jgi:hypothetical protein
MLTPTSRKPSVTPCSNSLYIPVKLYISFEAKVEKLHRESKGYLDSVRAMTLSQKRIAETVDHFYDEGASMGYAGMQYKMAVEKMDEEARMELVGFHLHFT